MELFESRNIEGYGGDRPEEVSIPEDLSFDLPYVYNGEELSVGVTISYSINECYPSENTSGGGSPFALVVICLVAFFIIGIVAFAVVFRVILKRIEMKAINRQNRENNQAS
jgi:hypothetical protein